MGDPLIIITGLITGAMCSHVKGLVLAAIPAAGVIVSVILTLFFQDRSINQQIPGGQELVILRFVAFAIYAGIGFGLRFMITALRQQTKGK